MITTMMWVIIVIIILVLLMILVLKMTKKYHITWYWCQNIRESMVEKRVKKFGQHLVWDISKNHHNSKQKNAVWSIPNQNEAVSVYFLLLSGFWWHFLFDWNYPEQPKPMWRHFKDIQCNLLTKPPFPFRSASVSTRMSRKPSVFATRSRESFPTPMLDKVGTFTVNVVCTQLEKATLPKSVHQQLNIKCLSLRSSARFPIGRRMLLWPERLWWRESRWYLSSSFSRLYLGWATCGILDDDFYL